MINRRVGTIILAVVCFFAGAVLFAEFPAVGTLIAFFEVGLGYLLGWFSNKDKVDLAKDLEETNEELVEELDKANKEIEGLNNGIKGLKAEYDREIRNLRKSMQTLKEENSKEVTTAAKTAKTSKKVSK